MKQEQATGGPGYKEFPFSHARMAVLDFVEEGRRKNHVSALVEVDVTEPLRLNGEIKKATGESLSFTGWLAKCIAQAVKEHEIVHAFRRGRKSLVIFDDVDISILVEETLQGASGPTKTFPLPYVTRAVDKKSVKQIHDEIRAVQGHPVKDRDVYPTYKMSPVQKFFFALPFSLRRLFFSRKFVVDPFYAKKVMGTVALTWVGMFGRGASGSAWGIPIGVHPVIVLVGGIARKPAVVEDRIIPRDFLSLTVLLDHDVVDGAPVARFLSRLRDLIEGGYGMKEYLAAL